MQRRAVMAFDVIKPTFAVGLTEVERARLAGDRKTAALSVLEFAPAKLRVSLTAQMSAKQDTAFPGRDVCGIKVRRFGAVRGTGLEQFADPAGRGAHRGGGGEEVVEDFPVPVAAVARRTAVIRVLIGDIAGFLADTGRVAEIRVVRERVIRGALQELRQGLGSLIRVVD